MLRHLPQPLNTGRFKRNIRIKTTSNGTMNNDLLLLFQQPDQFLLRPHKPPHPPIYIIQIPHDGGLFGERWEGQS